MISLSTGLGVFVGARRLRQQGMSRLVSVATPCLRSSLHSSSETSGLQPPDVARLAETARITLSPDEVKDFGPKIRQVVDWFAQLQEVNLESIEPAIRADVEVDSLPREDIPEIFENRDAVIEAIPCFEEPYVKVPKVLNMD